MLKRKEDMTAERFRALLEQHWKWVVVIAWLLFSAWFLYTRWNDLHAFALRDTDDNMRMVQARALLAGQDWFDLRNHRLFGSDIHWSRVVDLPLAGLILLLRPFLGGAQAQLAAAAIAPLIPYLVLLFGIALTARRLISPAAYPLPLIALVFAGSTNGMFMPDRIDHHGWQLALLSLTLAGLADPKRIRGGLTAGLATALSMAIGLEMLAYLALAGFAIVLFWVDDTAQRTRLAAYAVALGGGASLFFLTFASYANRQPICDALTPVWLSNALLGTALLLVAAWRSPGDWKWRLAVAAGIGAIVAVFHALSWPQCLQRLEGVSPQAYELWLSKVREARPIYRHGWQIAVMMVGIPISGLIGWLLLTWRNRIDRDLLRRTLAVAVPALAALLLLLWQTRTGPAAQMMGVIGAAAVLWVLAPLFWKSGSSALRIFGVAAVVLIGLGAVVPFGMSFAADKRMTSREIQVAQANRACNFIGSYRPIAKQPRGVVFTFVDLAPRLIALTHHNSITGPYHRNDDEIVDVMQAFRGSPEQARQILSKYESDYLLTCPNSSTTTIFRSEAPNGFYSQIAEGKVPEWLTPVPLPSDSPFKMWRVER